MYTLCRAVAHKFDMGKFVKVHGALVVKYNNVVKIAGIRTFYFRRISHKHVGPGLGLDRISHIAYVYAAGGHPPQKQKPKP